MTPAARRLLGTLLVYAGLLVVSVLLLRQDPIADSGWRYAVALLPVPAAAGILAATAATYRDADELAQRIQLQALAVAFLTTMLLAFTWGLLEGVGLPRVSGFVYFGILWVTYLGGLWWANRRYK